MAGKGSLIFQNSRTFVLKACISKAKRESRNLRFSCPRIQSYWVEVLAEDADVRELLDLFDERHKDGQDGATLQELVELIGEEVQAAEAGSGLAYLRNVTEGCLRTAL